MTIHISMRRLRADVTEAEFGELLSYLETVGFRPLLRGAKSAALDVIGVEAVATVPRSKRRRLFGIRPDSVIDGDLFISKNGETILYVRLKNTTERNDGNRGMITSFSIRPYVESGSIGAHALPEELDVLCSSIADYLKTKAKNAEAVWQWEGLAWTNEKFDKFRSEQKAQSPRFSLEEKLLAGKLRNQNFRHVALTIKSAGGMLAKDIRENVQKEGMSDVLQELLGSGLLEREYVVICQRTSKQVNRVRSPETIRELEKHHVFCSCGRKLSEERLEELLMPSEVARGLLDRSRWLSVVLVEQLEAAGLSPEDVVLNFQEGPDEVDAFVDVEGRLVMVELKDKEFSMGHAYKFSGRIGIYRPDYGLIVSTEQVASDVKEYFRQIEPQAKISYVDSLDALEPELDRIIEEIRSGRATQILKTFDSLPVLRYNLALLVGRRIGLGSPEDGNTDDGELIPSVIPPE
jgi:hypothetical protein